MFWAGIMWGGHLSRPDRKVARLIVVPTPIGNLEDLTFRAVRVLGEVHAIFAEDTRQTRKLLTRYSLTTPLYSYHQHTKYSRIPAVLEALERGDVALVSSAGTPSISTIFVSQPASRRIFAVASADRRSCDGS